MLTSLFRGEREGENKSEKNEINKYFEPFFVERCADVCSMYVCLIFFFQSYSLLRVNFKNNRFWDTMKNVFFLSFIDFRQNINYDDSMWIFSFFIWLWLLFFRNIVELVAFHYAHCFVITRDCNLHFFLFIFGNLVNCTVFHAKLSLIYSFGFWVFSWFVTVNDFYQLPDTKTKHII